MAPASTSQQSAAVNEISASIRRLPDMAGQLTALLEQIPRGRVTTYGSLATALGNIAASRWVGHFMLHHDHTAGCPCHRVVRAGGGLGTYISGKLDDQARLLSQEWIPVTGGRVDLEQYGFDPICSDGPLVQLTRLQEHLQEKVSLRSRVRYSDLVGGVDVSYAAEDRGTAAYALVLANSGRLVWSTSVERKIDFPYIPSYLSFRELPILIDLLEQMQAAGRLAEILLVDGSGIMHPRRAGIASYLGVAADIPTVGVTKKLLCGQVDIHGLECGQPRPVVQEGRKIGVAMRPRPASKRPLFVSPGHLCNVAAAAELVERLLRGCRLPEPIYWADRISRMEAAGKPAR